MLTPEQAAETLCPLARTFAVAQAQKGCHGPACACWRWEKVSTSHPLWKDAVKTEAMRTGENIPYPKAARYVADHASELGMAPERGFCGLGGMP